MQKNGITKLLGDTFIYGLSGVISSFIGVFLIPVYAHYFNPSEYGIISLLTSLQVLLTIFVVFGMDNSFSVWFYDNQSKEGRQKSVSVWVFFSFSISIIVFLLLLAFAKPGATYILGDSKYYLFFIYLGVSLCFTSLQKVVIMRYRLQLKPLKTVLFSLLTTLLAIGLNIFFVVVLHTGMVGIYYALMITGAATLLLSIYILWEDIHFKLFDFAELKKMIKFSFPLLAAALVMWLMGSATPYFIKLLILDNAEVGLYQMGASIANVMGLATFAFFQAYTPYALSIQHDTDARQKYAQFFLYYIYVGMTLALITAMVAPIILKVFTTSKYFDSKVIIGILAFNVVIGGISQIASIGNLLAKKNRSYFRASVFAGVITLAGFLLLIPLIGKTGAALAMLVGNVGNSVFLIIAVQKSYKIPYDFKKIIVFSILTLLLFGLFCYILY